MFHYLVALGLLLSSHQIMSNDNIRKTVVIMTIVNYEISEIPKS